MRIDRLSKWDQKRWKWVEKLVKVTYVDDLEEKVPGTETRARCVYSFPFPKIQVVNKYKSDTGLLVHEKCHAVQFFRNPFKAWYIRNDKVTRERETEAFAWQLSCDTVNTKNGITRSGLFASYIVNCYGLDPKPNILEVEKELLAIYNQVK